MFDWQLWNKFSALFTLNKWQQVSGTKCSIFCLETLMDATVWRRECLSQLFWRMEIVFKLFVNLFYTHILAANKIQILKPFLILQFCFRVHLPIWNSCVGGSATLARMNEKSLVNWVVILVNKDTQWSKKKDKRWPRAKRLSRSVTARQLGSKDSISDCAPSATFSSIDAATNAQRRFTTSTTIFNVDWVDVTPIGSVSLAGRWGQPKLIV